MKMKPKKCTNVSAHYNVKSLYDDEIPKQLTDEVLEDFIKKEILLSKTCACDFCVFRKNMFRRMQEIIKERNLK